MNVQQAYLDSVWNNSKPFSELNHREIFELGWNAALKSVEGLQGVETKDTLTRTATQ